MEFVRVPYLPNDAGVVIIDGRFKSLGTELKKRNIEVIYTQRVKQLAEPVAYHPDMQICHLGGKDFVVASECYDYYVDMLSPFGAIVTKGNAHLNVQYPQDTAYNIARVGKSVLLNKGSADPVIMHYLSTNGINIVNIKQGYAKCSVCIVNANAIITYDKGIVNAVKQYGIDCLLISSGHITLEGYDYGFIGGASGLIKRDLLAFAGNIEAHPDYTKINEFCNERGVGILRIMECELTDIGSIMPIVERK